MIKGFEFTDGGRSYSCSLEDRHGADSEAWWWFTVSGDGQRYAPFRAAKDDSRTTVQERIVRFYTDRLFARAQPAQRGSQWGRRPVPVVKPAPEVPASPA